jgi:TrmH family RNA methyltransferase
VIRDIAGRQNHSVKLAHKLLKKKHRRERGLLVCEGMDLLRAAVDAGADVREVLVRRDLVSDLPGLLAKEASSPGEGEGTVGIGICDAETLEYASSLGGGVDVIFICGDPAWSLSDIATGEGVTFFLDGVGDPGNVGTLVRSALAFGLAGVICSPGTADPYGPKAMRAGMGAQFTLPVATEVSSSDLRARLEAAAERGDAVPDVWVADPHMGDDISSAQLGAGTVVVLGAERTGPGSGWADARRVTIPQQRFESINVAMAGTIFAYESCLASRRAPGGK